MDLKIRFNRFVRYVMSATLLLWICSATADNSLDQEKVSMCVACHGADGIGKANQYPSLQGLPADYIVTQLKAFKSGDRKSSTMNVVAKPLSDDDMQMLASFFNQVK
jgi:cytochrome c553